MFISKPNEDGVVFVTGKRNQYLVTYCMEDEYFHKIENAWEIFDRMDMADCYDISIVRIMLLDNENITECVFRGVWHDDVEHLKMQIEDKETGEVYDVGYGTDH